MEMLTIVVFLMLIFIGVILGVVANKLDLINCVLRRIAHNSDVELKRIADALEKKEKQP